MAEYSFRKSQRLLKSLDFDRVFAAGKSRADRTLVVYAVRSQLVRSEGASGEGGAGKGGTQAGMAKHGSCSRLGLVVSRKCGNAVRRNRWKRVLREAFRTQRLRLPAGLDLVVIPRPQATPTLGSVSRSLVKLTEQLDHQLVRVSPDASPPVVEEPFPPSSERRRD